MKQFRVALVLVTMLSGCTPAPEVALNLTVDSQDPAVVTEARRVLLYRFGEFRSTFFSKIESSVDGQRISFRFRGGAPENSILTYLYETPGSVETSLKESSTTLFTDQDIEQAELAHVNETSIIHLRLTPTAGERVLALTSQNIGKTARMTLDGRPLLEARIAGAFRDSFQITSPETDSEKAMALVVVLRSGALPAAVVLDEQDGI